MSEYTSHIETTVAETVHHEQKSFFDPNTQMVALTWITFLFLFIILYKFAFKPILSALDSREQFIKKSVEDADKIQHELAVLNEKSRQVMNKADEEAKHIVSEARKAAQEATRVIEQKAKQEAQIVLDNAKRDIKEEIEKAQAKIKKQSADTAVTLAGKLIEKNLDDESNRKLIDRLIEDIK